MCERLDPLMPHADAGDRTASDEQLLLRYRALGATWLHIVDLDGAREDFAIVEPTELPEDYLELHTQLAAELG